MEDVNDRSLLAALMDLGADEVAACDREGRVVRLNAAMARRLGLADPHAADGKAFADLLPLSEVEDWRSAARRALADDPAPARDEFRTSRGMPRWFQTAVVPARDDDGAVTGTVTVARDITSLKESEQALRESEALFASLLEQLPLNVFRKDRAGRFQYVNNRLCAIMGVAREQMLGKTDFDFSSHDLAAKYRADDERVMETRATFDGVEEHQPRDGEPTYIRVFKVPVLNTRNEVVGTQGFFVDVTDIKRTEKALARRTAELEEVLRQLQENAQKLLISEKMASLGRLTAGIAHEMNTPLAAVRTALIELGQLAEEYRSSIGDPDVTPDDHKEIAVEMQKTIRLAANAANRAQGFVHGVKSHTRDMTPKEKRRFNAVPIIDEALLLLTHGLRKGHCEVDFKRSGESIEIEGSPGRLAQVVTNLVNNAIDAMKGVENAHVYVRLNADAEGVTLEVQDTGCGIPPDLIHKIFDPMFTTKPFGEGTGLGLTIVHNIVTGDFGGKIDVRSEPGKGTTFTVWLPAIVPEPHGP